jgi:hypothetical protein
VATLTIINPISDVQANAANAQRFPPAKRLKTLDGKTIGLFWNAKAGGEVALRRTRENLLRLFPGATFKDYFGAHGTHMRRASNEQLDNIAREVHAVVGTTSD